MQIVTLLLLLLSSCRAVIGDSGLRALDHHTPFRQLDAAQVQGLLTACGNTAVGSSTVKALSDSFGCSAAPSIIDWVICALYGSLCTLNPPLTKDALQPAATCSISVAKSACGDCTNNQCCTDAETQINGAVSLFKCPSAPAPTTSAPAPTTPAPAPPITPPGITCFSGSATVKVEAKGEVVMKDLQLGDKVYTGSEYDLVYAFAHRDMDARVDFLQIYTRGLVGQPLQVSGNHMMYIHGKSNPVRAVDIEVGDTLQDGVGNGSVVTKIETVKSKGLYAPLTASGKLLVDGLVASSYVAVLGTGREFVELAGVTLPITHSAAGHTFSTPLRMMCMSVSPKICEWQSEGGMHPWLNFGRKLASAMDNQHFLMQLIILIVALCLLLPLVLIESMFGPIYGPLAIVGVLCILKHSTTVTKKGILRG